MFPLAGSLTPSYPVCGFHSVECRPNAVQRSLQEGLCAVLMAASQNQSQRVRVWSLGKVQRLHRLYEDKIQAFHLMEGPLPIASDG